MGPIAQQGCTLVPMWFPMMPSAANFFDTSVIPRGIVQSAREQFERIAGQWWCLECAALDHCGLSSSIFRCTTLYRLLDVGYWEDSAHHRARSQSVLKGRILSARGGLMGSACAACTGRQ